MMRCQLPYICTGVTQAVLWFVPAAPRSWLSSDTHVTRHGLKKEEREDKSILIQDKQHTEGGLHQPSRSGQNTSISHETQSKKHG